MISERAYPALRLNADFRPTGFPLSKSSMGWQDAVSGVVRNRLIVVEEYPRVIRCPGSHRRAPFEMKLPAVVALKEYERQDRPAAFTRAGVFLRDGNQCAYCGIRQSSSDLTFDHVVPRSRGGLNCYSNVVSACTECNTKKSNKLLSECRMSLRYKPYTPTRAQLIDMGVRKLTSRSGLPKLWLPYLGLEDSKASTFVGNIPATNGAFPPDMTSEDYWHVELEE